ncbi:uncharacterized protein NDAI_0F02540 [Naumovozyma dairenensis CBS 421]|uniref:C2 domain-containing protein n=1 Tax=Naumovozyma dairenensis (strain ATCC 10597 / BCRC 20456 / CBS 421 / NBRC 0211 / NRRL Y-12639) TaxID=1071378 RepID=G0WCR1_NAUDC|nr:hypothetical protein NDAI_0F02540 [Naumovozyma dairenensis CBS 421]CCD25572.1 hypothetical protein NDAI_0F02540 [Naumovozyma dairenensis CBS 421]
MSPNDYKKQSAPSNTKAELIPGNLSTIEVKEESSEGVAAYNKPPMTSTVNQSHFSRVASYVGWKQIGGWEEVDSLGEYDSLFELNEDTFLDNIIPDKFYGKWYHPILLFIIAGFSSFLLGYFKFSFAPVYLIAVAAALVYRALIKGYRSSIRELIEKESAVEKIEDDYESVEWANLLFVKYWPILEPSLSQKIVTQVNGQLASNMSIPKWIKAIWIDEFTLGIKPPRIGYVKTLQNTHLDVVVMDWNVSFTPHDQADMNARQVRNFVNSKVLLKINVMGVILPMTLSDLAIDIKARLKFQLMAALPIIETINIQLLKVPNVDFIASLFNISVFNMDLLTLPGFLTLANKMAYKYMSEILLPPFSLQLNLPQLLSGSATSIGILEINVKAVKGFKRNFGELLGKPGHPYVSFLFSNRVIAKTSASKDPNSPIWHEVVHIPIKSFTEPLSVILFDKHKTLKDKNLGGIEFNLNSLRHRPHQKRLKSPILKNSKSIGYLHFDLHFRPVLEQKKLPNGKVEEIPDLNTGLAKIVIQESRLINEIEKKFDTYVELYINAKKVFTTKKVSGVDNWRWKSQYESIILDRSMTRCKFVIKDKKSQIISSSVQNLNALIDRTSMSKDIIPLKNGVGDLKIMTYWKPVELGLYGKGTIYTAPIGTVRILINKAKFTNNVDKIMEVNPYTRVLTNDLEIGRTNELLNELNPIWNQAIYVAITSPNQKILLECMDSRLIGGDRSLGQLEISPRGLLRKGDDDRYEEFINENAISSQLTTRKGLSGEITYYISFYPSLPILTREEIEDLEKVRERRRQLLQKKASLDPLTESKELKERILDEECEIHELEDIFSNKMKLDLNELIQYPSGILTISVQGGELPFPGLYVQTFLDSLGHASIISPKCSIRTIKTGWIGEATIKELEWSVTTFKVVKNKSLNKAEVGISEFVIPTIELINNCYREPCILNLSGISTAKLMVQVSYFPLHVTKLPLSDLITNTGDLTITIKGANDLIAGDRNGYSDPYVKLYLNNNEKSFFKTKISKKTLNPVWNESTTLQINDRVNTFIKFKVVDWDGALSNDLLGWAMLPLSQIDPAALTKLEVPIVTEKEDKGGFLQLEFTFSPRYTLGVQKRSKNNIGDLAQKGIDTGIRAGTTVLNTSVVTIGKMMDEGQVRLRTGIVKGVEKKLTGSVHF